jgi:hypothetical protein
MTESLDILAHKKKASGYRRGVEAAMRAMRHAPEGASFVELYDRVRTLLTKSSGETSEPNGTIVEWAGKKMRVGRCPPGDTCLACDRLGSHLEPIDPPEASGEKP